jgi:hypothetical protein
MGQKMEIEIEDDNFDNDDKVELLTPEQAQEQEEAAAKKKKADDDLELEIVDDTPEEDRGRKKSEPPEEVTDDELENYSEKIRQRIKHFSKGYHDERREKEAAIRERQELENYARKLLEENNNLKQTTGKSREMLLRQAKQRVESDLQQAKREYKEAYEAGNGDALLEAQEKLNIAQNRSSQLENIKLPALQEQESAVKGGSSVTNQPQQRQVDPKAQAWTKENTWFGTDDEMTGFALAVHQKLVKGGVDPQSDEYYEKLNARMRTVFPDNFEDTGESTKNDSDASVVAPVTRTTSPKKLRLTQSQVRIAKKLGVPLEQYAKEVASLDRGQ